MPLTAHARWMIVVFLVVAVLPCVAQESEPKVKLNLKELGISGLGGNPGFGSSQPAKFSASFKLTEGSRKGTLLVSASIEANWHVYSISQPPGGPMPTKIKVTETADFKVLGPFQADQPPHVKPPDPKGFNVNSEEHEEFVAWSAPLEIAADADPANFEISVLVNGQVCRSGEGGQCIPFSEKLAAKFAGYEKPHSNLGEYRPDSKFEAEAVLSGHIAPASVQPGGKARLVITAKPTPGWHVYAYSPIDPDQANKPTLIVLSPLPAGWTRSPVVASAEPKVEPAHDGLPETYTHEEPVTWTIDLSIPGDAARGEHVISGYLGFQTCKNKGGCLPPQIVRFRASVPIAEKETSGTIPLEFSKPKKAGPMKAPGEITNYEDVAKLAAASPAPTGKVNWSALAPFVGFGLLGGLILNLMPCVLPVIGLKVLSFVQQGGESRGRIFMLNVWFALGLLSVFLVLATLAAFGSLIPGLGQNLSWGQQFTYTGFKVAMVVVVFAFALSFLGVWEVPIPGFAQSSSSSKLQQQEGLTGAFFKGIFTTLLATPCSGPFLGPVFAFTLAQPPIVTYIIFASVGLGMASPYLLIGAFPRLVKWLPKPGQWMETFKQLMGFVLLGTVVYLFATINADWFIPTLALMMAVWLACWIIGKVPIYESTGKQLTAWAVGCAVAALIGWASFTYLGPVKHLYEWQPYSPESIAKLQAEGKTVMVDFTANWCLTCQANFRLAINTHKVKEVVERNGVVPMLADWTDKNETIKVRLQELNSNSIPLMAIYPAGKPGEVIVLRDALLESHVLAALAQAGASHDPTRAATTEAAAAVTASSKGAE
ncbi:MAG: thioredoxin family protein [Planctomycetaceae bacterium]|nr:thioredoxin family protein [Planctomycetaceae bacterium]